MWWWHYFNFTERSIPITNRNRYAMRQNYLAVWKMLSYWQKCVQAGPVALFWKPWLRILKKSSYKTKFYLINGMLNSSKKEILKVIVIKNIVGKMGITELMPQVTGKLYINQLNYSFCHLLLTAGSLCSCLRFYWVKKAHLENFGTHKPTMICVL